MNRKKMKGTTILPFCMGKQMLFTQDELSSIGDE